MSAVQLKKMGLNKIWVGANKRIPKGWRLLTVAEATTIKAAVLKKMTQWEICELKGGKIEGPGHKGKIVKGDFFGKLGHVALGKKIGGGGKDFAEGEDSSTTDPEEKKLLAKFNENDFAEAEAEA